MDGLSEWSAGGKDRLPKGWTVEGQPFLLSHDGNERVGNRSWADVVDDNGISTN